MDKIAEDPASSEEAPSISRERPIPVLINKEGGTAASTEPAIADQIREGFAAIGREAAVQLLSPSGLEAALPRLMDHPLVVIGGGDGTLGSASLEFTRSGSSTLGILPLGTRNHLARQLHIPMDLPGAIDVLLRGQPRAIDIGRVNELAFINNASIGFYPLMVRWRDEERERRGLPKWAANIVAGIGVLRRLRHHQLRLTLDGKPQTIRTPLLFVGNNAYSLDAGHIGERTALDDGDLSVFAVASHTRAGSIWFAVRTMFGWASPENDFAVCDTCRELEVSAHSGRINVALDGELHRLSSPLQFSVLPGALTVMAPPPDADKE